MKNYVLNLYRYEQLVYGKVDESFLDGQVLIWLLLHLRREIFLCFFNHAIAALSLQKCKICQLKIDKESINQEIADQISLSVYTVKCHYTTFKKLRNSETRLCNN